MEQPQIEEILRQVAGGSLSIDKARVALEDLPFHDLGFAKIDHHRALRTGHPEVIFCQGKQTEHIEAIVQEQLDHDETVLGTRVSADALHYLAKRFPQLTIEPLARCFWKKSTSWKLHRSSRGPIVIATGGTADSAVAEEARVTIAALGYEAVPMYDVGVAGIHRLFAHHQLLRDAGVIIAVAGMEGALPSVITGLVSCPVIGVPTSIGYGSHLQGLVALMAMLNSCSSGLSVVNIDNGFGAGFSAVSIVRDRTPATS
jgi:NCAIR mutase (PurE)-related protein